MAGERFHFHGFTLDADDRQLLHGDARLEVNSRYLDALLLLVRESGRLVSKDRFMDEVWRGVPVTDEALTQCIKTLRRQLGDDAARPRFIETVPKHGYRFIAPLEAAMPESGAPTPAPAPAPAPARPFFHPGIAGTVGAGAAGLAGGLVYGLASTAQPLGQGMGAASVLVVLLCCTMLVALAGGAGVAFGIALAARRTGGVNGWSVAGGAAGGAIVGALVKLVGVDTFTLLLGRSPGNITGPGEGAVLGAAVGLGTWLAMRMPGSLRRRAFVAGVPGLAAGALIPLLGGRMFGGSLDLLARQFPDSRLRIGALGGLLGEQGFGPLSQTVTGALEGGLFSGCLVAGLLIAWRAPPA